MKRWAVALALALAACGEGSALDRLAAGEHGRVAQVRSGDVVVLESGLVVRLAGLQVPREGEPGADEARAALAGLVQGKDVQLYYGGARRDRTGRALAQMRLIGGGWVEAAMLRAGEAEARTFADNRALARPMLDDEARARIAKKGLWRAGGAFSVRLPRELAGGDGGFQIVEGPVARVNDTGRGVYLEFTGRPDGFAAEIAPSALGDLSAAGLAAQRLAGRMVRVRGMVGWDGLMRIDHPEQIETVDGK
jgi:endonuclease YncB( thermonuclease family)